MKPLRLVVALVVASGLLSPSAAQEVDVDSAGAREMASERLHVYLDCPEWRCDFDHFRREISFVTWVRDPEDADLHVLVTSQRTGGGGEEITLTFLGRGEFESLRRELAYTSGSTETEEETREALTRTLSLGLVPYAARTPAAEHLKVIYEGPTADSDTTPGTGDDAWNLWVFGTGLRMSMSGESSATSVSLSGDISANRTSEAWKIDLEIRGNYRENTFELSDGRTITSISRSYGAESLVARSMGAHWSAGFRSSARSSIFRNHDLALRLAPAVEYNLHPYAESTRRRLTFLYAVGPSYFDYREETIFGETEQTLVDHSLEISLDLQEPWGSANASLEGAHYLHDISKNRISLFGSLDVRLFRGLSFNTFGRIERVSDQINLRAGEASEEEILLRRQELATDFRYRFSAGFRYTFGSIFNNIVNPRLDD